MENSEGIFQVTPELKGNSSTSIRLAAADPMR